MISSIELAKLCGVSQGTVDRALHGRDGISRETRKRILEAAELHGYRANPAARELMTGRSRIVAAVIPQLNSAFLMDFAGNVKSALDRTGLHLIITPTDTPEEMTELINEFAARRCRAMLVVPHEDGFKLPAGLDMPVASFLSRCKGGKTVFLHPDEKASGAAAVDYFVALGRHNIAHLTYNRQSHAVQERAAGYSENMLKHGLKPQIITDRDQDSLLEFIKTNKVDALFCHNDWLALNALRALERHGVKVPREISILGMDNSPLFTSLCDEISTIQYPFEWLAGEFLAVINGGTGQTTPAPSPEIIKRRT
ncbi:MAG: LacI family DNA-binding transcriptional regulator [Victivallaceae bacterium]